MGQENRTKSSFDVLYGVVARQSALIRRPAIGGPRHPWEMDIMTIHEKWLESVKKSFQSKTSDWGIAGMYECKIPTNSPPGACSHEKVLQDQLLCDGFTLLKRSYPNNNREHPDGAITHNHFQEHELWYELKSVFLPHYHGKNHPHNHDYERLLRLGHPSGAIGDVQRLRALDPQLDKAFVLLGISWTDGTSSELVEFENHCNAVLDLFNKLAGIPDASKKDTFTVRGTNPSYLWSCVIRTWKL